MFLLLPLLRQLAQHSRAWVVLSCGAVLLAGGIGISLAGIAMHQPLVTRTGFLVLLVTVIYAVIAVRGRRSRSS
jgi:cell division inhibitor SulA